MALARLLERFVEGEREGWELACGDEREHGGTGFGRWPFAGFWPTE